LLCSPEGLMRLIPQFNVNGQFTIPNPNTDLQAFLSAQQGLSNAIDMILAQENISQNPSNVGSLPSRPLMFASNWLSSEVGIQTDGTKLNSPESGGKFGGYRVQSFLSGLYQSAECLTLQGYPNHSQNDSTWQTERFAMGQAIAVRMDYTSDEVRQLAKRAKDASQARRLLAIAVVLDGASREEAAKAGGMERQTLRDWVIRFNEEGPDGLVNKSSPGAPGKLTEEHKAFLVRLVEEGPIPAVDGVVRWRACDLIMRLYEEFGISVSDDTVYRALKDLGFSHVSARPRAYKQNADAMEAFKKTFLPAWRKSGRGLRPAHR
jgi:putative transposase